MPAASLPEVPFRFFVAVKGIVRAGERLLVVRRSALARGEPGTWELPGGRLEFGEAPEDALRRELQEEVGLAAVVERPVATWTFVRGGLHQTVGITFLCHAAGMDVRLSAEHDAFKWIAPADLAHAGLPPHIAAGLQRLDWERMG